VTVGAGRIAPWVLDLDHIRPVVAEHHRGDWSGVNGADVQHADPFERSRRRGWVAPVAVDGGGHRPGLGWAVGRGLMSVTEGVCMAVPWLAGLGSRGRRRSVAAPGMGCGGYLV
jgi:hypothetical protein